MTACSMAMPSYTYAMKAEKLLKTRGIACEIIRNEKTSADGCGYSVYIKNNCSDAMEILRNYAVPYTGITEGGV